MKLSEMIETMDKRRQAAEQFAANALREHEAMLANEVGAWCVEHLDLPCQHLGSFDYSDGPGYRLAMQSKFDLSIILEFKHRTGLPTMVRVGRSNGNSLHYVHQYEIQQVHDILSWISILMTESSPRL